MIVGTNPKSDLDHVDQAWFDSDASNNSDAIREIDREAAKFGLVRTNEYWLQVFSAPEGTLVRRGFTYRPTPSDEVADRIARRRNGDPVGVSSADMVREMRDE